MNDRRVAKLLDALTPTYDDRQGDWQRVAEAARPAGAPRWRARLVAVAAAAAALGTLVLAWPFQAEEGVLDRALAALGDGPVLHVVLRGEWGGTLVDLETGARRPVHGEKEVWYDTKRGLVHSVSRLGGAVQYEEVYEPNDPPAELVALGREYRQALDSGSARVSGEGMIDGEPVVWVTIRRELLPDVADGRDHEWAQHVAVSRRTYKPVALRETRDGEPGPGTGQRVLELEFLPAGQGDFTAAPANVMGGGPFKAGREPIALEQAREVLGRDPVWLGREHAGLPLSQVFRMSHSRGRRREVRVTGAAAQAAIECTKLRGERAGECIRALGPHPLRVGPDGVFTQEGPVVWEDEQTGVSLFYGTVGDNPDTYHEDVVPLVHEPHVTITQSTRRSAFPPHAVSYVPPDGWAFIAAGGRMGAVRVDGLHVSIEASAEELVLSTARALEPMRD